MSGKPDGPDLPDLPNLKDRFCFSPFEMFEVERTPVDNVFACCPAWLPTQVGSVRTQSVEEIWNSPILQDIRKSILDGSYKYCDKGNCPYIRSGTLPKKSQIGDPYYGKIIREGITRLPGGPKTLNLANDRSCNLSCPSCRTQKIMVTSGEAYEHMRETHDKLLQGALPTLKRLSLCGSGDPFASKIYREILTTLDGSKYPELKIQIVTNGQLLTPEMWEKMKKIHGNIDRIQVSFDAATPETYRIVRRGGELPKLIENVKFLSQLRKKNIIEFLELDFVVQWLNYREMPDFVRLGKRLDVDRCFFQRIVSWNTYSESEFPRQAIYRGDHPEHPHFLEVLKDPIFKDPIVHLGNIAEFAPR